MTRLQSRSVFFSVYCKRNVELAVHSSTSIAFSRFHIYLSGCPQSASMLAYKQLLSEANNLPSSIPNATNKTRHQTIINDFSC
jgi:hypothetical protein